MQQAHRDAVDAAALEHARGLHNRCFVERGNNVAVRIDAFDDLEPVAALDEGRL